MPVEAIACGCPVLALAEGGVLDSMTPATALFFTEATPEALAGAMLRFESRSGEFPPAILRAHAAQFSEASFAARFSAILADALATYLQTQTVPRGTEPVAAGRHHREGTQPAPATVPALLP